VTLLSREDWLTKLAEQIGRALSKDGLEPAEDLAMLGGGELTKALIVASVAAMHSSGRFLDEIVEKVTAGRWMRDGIDHGDVAIAGISTYRLGRFPGPKWWDAATLEISLLECWADEALRSAPRAQVEDLLRTRWLVEDRAVSPLAEGLGEPAAVGPLEEIQSRAEQSPSIAQVLELGATQAAMTAAQTALPEAFANHRRIADLSASIGFVKSLKRARAGGEGTPDQGAVTQLAKLGETLIPLIKEEIVRLSLLETTAFEPVSDSERALREAVEGTRKRIHIPELGPGIVIPNGLSDRFGEVTLAADNLKDDVFSAGARSGLLAWGPSAYMWLALEDHELPPDGTLLPLGLGLPEGDGPPSLISLQIAADEDAPLSMDYRVGHTDETRRWLAMLALSKRITIDVFELNREGSLKLLLRAIPTVEDLVSELRPRITEVIAGMDPAPFLTGSELEEHVLAGFGLSENAKSELLLAIAGDTEAPAEVADARQRLLDAQVERARTLYAGDDPTQIETRVDTAMREYSEARSRAGPNGGHRLKEDPVGAHRALVSGFARDRRAVVHYNFKNGRIQGFWSADEGGSRGWISGEEIDLNALVEAAQPWLEAAHGDVDALLSAAQPVAAELDEALSEVEVDEVLILPWSVLNGVPFAAIPLGDSTFGDRYRVNYAPSLALLRPLINAVPSTKTRIELVSAHNGSLGWADSEVAAAQAIYPAAAVTPDRSPRADVLAAIERGRIVHLATHGQSWRDDPFASSLDLRFGGRSDSHVSAAEIYRDVDLSGAELVALSACDTGRSPSLRHGVEVYSGLDAAFIAKGAKAVLSSLWPINDLAAMLFMTNLHAQLAEGKQLNIAFELSVDLLRAGQLADLPADHPASVALEAAGIEWRAATIPLVSLFQQPRIWAAFKLSGAPWLSQPLPASG
jgi:CHAT domain-containing protein